MAEAEKRKKPQRNALRSQKLIKKAFAKLLYEKELSKITVSDVVKEAEICRGTFYAHYIDINDLYEQLKREIIDDIIKYIDGIGVVTFLDAPRKTLEIAMTEMEKDKEFYRNLLINKSATEISKKLISSLRDKFVDDIALAYRAKAKDEIGAFLIFLSGGIEGIFIKWLTDRAPLSTERTIDLTCNMIAACKNTFLTETI